MRIPVRMTLLRIHGIKVTLFFKKFFKVFFLFKLTLWVMLQSWPSTLISTCPDSSLKLLSGWNWLLTPLLHSHFLCPAHSLLHSGTGIWITISHMPETALAITKEVCSAPLSGSGTVLLFRPGWNALAGGEPGSRSRPASYPMLWTLSWWGCSCTDREESANHSEILSIALDALLHGKVHIWEVSQKITWCA